MAGFGFNSASNNMGASSAKKPQAGIQFVKSSEVVGSPRPLIPSSAGGGHSSSSFAIDGAGAAQSVLSPTSGQLGQPNTASPTSKPGGSSTSYGNVFVKSGEAYSSLKSTNSFRSASSSQGYRMPGQSNLNKGGLKSGSGGNAAAVTKSLQRTPEAKPVCTTEEYLKAWKAEKDADLAKLRKLAYEVVSLKSDRPNAKDKLHSAANRVPIRIEFNIEPVFGAKCTSSFLCYVYIEGVCIASGQGPKRKDAKTSAYEAALQKVLMPHLRIVSLTATSKELQVSRTPFTSPPTTESLKDTTTGSKDLMVASSRTVPSQHKESNMEAAGLKRRYNEYKSLDEFVVVEPKVPIQDCTAAHTLRRSADFNHMLLEYEYFFKGEAARCILRIENQILADVNGGSKVAAKNAASVQALGKLKKFCWIIKTKQAVDSNTKISKDEMLNELNEQSDSISHDNIGNKLLRKMGWSGGGVGKDGSGIAEPVSLKSVLNREGLGLSATKGITDEFRRKIKDVIETYAASDNQEDLVFSCDFRLEERQIIHDECRRLNLRSKSKGKGQKRYLCVRRKRSVSQLFDHLMSVGGETARYQLVPPGQQMDALSTFSAGSAPQSAGGCQPQFSADTYPKSFGAPNDSGRVNNNGGVPQPLMKDAKQFLPQKRNSPIPNSGGTNTHANHAGFGMPSRSTPNRAGDVSAYGFGRGHSGNGGGGGGGGGSGVNNFTAGRGLSMGNHSQNRSPGNFDRGADPGYDGQNNGSGSQRVRGSANNKFVGYGMSSTNNHANRTSFNSSYQAGFESNNSRSNAHDHNACAGYDHQGNHFGFPAQPNAPSFGGQAGGNKALSGSAQQRGTGTIMPNGRFQQPNAHPHAFGDNSGGGGGGGRELFQFQGHQSNNPAFNNSGGMPMGGGRNGGAGNSMAPAGAAMNHGQQRTGNPNSNGPSGYNNYNTNDGGQWASSAGAFPTSQYPRYQQQQHHHHQQHHQQGMGSGSNRPPHSMGGGYR